MGGADMKGRRIKPGGANAGKWDEEAVCGAATIDVGDVLVVTGMVGNYKRVAKADSDVAAEIHGPLYMAISKGIANGRMRIASRGVITKVTTGSAVGDPVFMSTTPGGVSVTPVAGGRKVGSVIVVGVAGVGKIDFNGGVVGAGVKMGIAAVGGAANVTVTAATLEGAYGGRPVVCTTNTGTTIYVLTAVWSTNDLVITFSASFTGNVSYMIGIS